MSNIGATLSSKLIAVGIKSPNALKQVGSQNAWLKLKKTDPSSCLSSLYAPEGAIQGIRWHDLSDESKKHLKAFYNKNKLLLFKALLPQQPNDCFLSNIYAHFLTVSIRYRYNDGR